MNKIMRTQAWLWFKYRILLDENENHETIINIINSKEFSYVMTKMIEIKYDKLFIQQFIDTINSSKTVNNSNLMFSLNKIANAIVRTISDEKLIQDTFELNDSIYLVITLTVKLYKMDNDKNKFSGGLCFNKPSEVDHHHWLAFMYGHEIDGLENSENLIKIFNLKSFEYIMEKMTYIRNDELFINKLIANVPNKEINDFSILRKLMIESILELNLPSARFTELFNTDIKPIDEKLALIDVDIVTILNENLASEILVARKHIDDEIVKNLKMLSGEECYLVHKPIIVNKL